MQFKKKLMLSGIASAITLISSIFIPIVPCRIAPNVPNPIYEWTLCSLNPDGVNLYQSIKEYFGYTISIRDSYILTIIISFTLAMIFFHFATKRKSKK